jgi:hypothetical protein
MRLSSVAFTDFLLKARWPLVAAAATATITDPQWKEREAVRGDRLSTVPGKIRERKKHCKT